MPEAGSTAQAGTANDAGSNNQTAQGAGGSQAAAGSRTFTQEEVNNLVAKERRDQESRFSDYEDLKAKAEKLDEIEEASKSDLEKAQAEAARYKAKAEKLEADAKRAADVAEMAGRYDVDAALLGRMGGDVEENAQFRPVAGAFRTQGNDPFVQRYSKRCNCDFPLYGDWGSVTRKERPLVFPCVWACWESGWYRIAGRKGAHGDGPFVSIA